MTELLTAAEMRALERAAIDSGAVTGLELMERAGRGVVEAILADWRELATGARRAVVLCGPGNNGGDGFVVARLLRERGWVVEVFLYGDPDRLPPDARTNYERWTEQGGVAQLAHPTLSGTDLDILEPLFDGSQAVDVVIDAIFGIGLTRPAEGLNGLFDLNEFHRYRERPKWVAVDVPTGMCADSGRTLSSPSPMSAEWAVLMAHLTVTFHRRKPGHVLGHGPMFCERLRVVDIGLEQPDRGQTRVFRTDQEAGGPARSAAPAVRLLRKYGNRHKYDHGHALVLSGGPGKGGAARLAARGALRIGAGLVTLGCPPAALQENAAALDAIMLRPLRDPDHLTEILGDPRLNALCLGPGFGLGERTRAFVAVALAAGRATVLDGDALTAFAEDPAALFALTHKDVVLTPHAGEFACLFPDLAERLAAEPATGPAFSRLDATREAAARAGCVVLHKGPDTVIAGPDGRAAINAAAYDRAAPWLATAGSGDVLAGFVTGLLARGFPPDLAAETAAWLHVECALAFGPGLIAEDLPEALPAVYRTLGL